MDNTPVRRKPHTSTADLLVRSETDSPVTTGVSVRSHQSSDGIRKTVFGGQVTDEELVLRNISQSIISATRLLSLLHTLLIYGLHILADEIKDDPSYELLHQMEPYINQVLTYAQQSRERSNYEKAALSERMQDYKRQIDRESRWHSNGSNGSPNGDGIQAIVRSSHKMIEAVMQSAARGKVQTIRQGYLSKRSSNLRGDWKRRFFVLDSRGMLYYYRKQCSKSSSSGNQHSGQRNSSELGSGLLSRWLSSNNHHVGVHDEKSIAHHTVNLLTSTIKVDADQSDLRFCFRIISPTKNYTLQAESALDQMDWIEKITGVASLLSSQTPERCMLGSPMGSGHHRSASESSSFESSDFDHGAAEEYASERGLDIVFNKSLL
ncbi:hypothetical protein ACFE04_000527 [Oxalis oulophora]